MKISSQQLTRFCPATPLEPITLKNLLDDLGLEVKRLAVNGADALITLELLANRGDHHCYVGVAREIAARLQAPLIPPELAEVRTGTPPIPIHIADDACLLYSLTPFNVLKPGKAPLGINESKLLAAADVYTGHPLIDVTNLVNLELGQPTHAFDADTLAGGITVRLSIAGEKAWLLFTPEPREIPAGTLVIADEKKILAIAGVIGCEESKVVDTTRQMLLESAAFDPVTVRKAARALRVQTDSSARFERGSDPAMVVAAIGRVARVLKSAAVAEQSGPTGLIGKWTDPHRLVHLDLLDCERFFLRKFEPLEIVTRLERYGFRHAGGLSFVVPTHRLWDIENAEDLYEELARSIGLNELPQALPVGSVGTLPSDVERVQETVDEILTADGFYEVYTDGFYSRQMRQKLGIEEFTLHGTSPRGVESRPAHDLVPGKDKNTGETPVPPTDPLWTHVETSNALDKTYSLLKNNCLGQALEAVASNLRFQARDVRLFEWTRTFHPAMQASDGPCRERHMLWAIGTGSERPDQWDGAGRPLDLFSMKGLVEEIREALDVPLKFAAPGDGYPLSRLLHPFRSLIITLSGQPVGAVGEVHPDIVRNFGIKTGRPIYVEIERAALLQTPAKRPFTPPPAAPEIERMLSFVVPPDISVREMLPILKSRAPSWLTRLAIADVFDKPGKERSVAFRLEFQALPPRTADEFNTACEAMVASVVEAFGPRGVRLR